MKKIIVFLAILLCSESLISQTKTYRKSKSKSKTSSKTTTATTATTTTSNSSTNDVFGNISGTLGGLLGSKSSSGGMTQNLAADGLKSALKLGAELATNNLGKMDGYLANEAVKILLPKEVRQVESTLRSMGMGSLCDNVIVSLNRAAESAVVEAKPVFVSAITNMTITDAINILTGDKRAATDYLMKTSGKTLLDRFHPIIKSNLDKANATKYWNNAASTYNKIPFVAKVNPDISSFVTQKAIDGVFLMVAKEEAKIRENPTARVGSVLQDVFGWVDKNKK